LVSKVCTDAEVELEITSWYYIILKWLYLD